MSANGGLVTLAKYGPEYFGELGRRSKSANIYGPTAAHRRLRMIDIRARRSLTDAAWSARMRDRERAFGLAPGTLK